MNKAKIADDWGVGENTLTKHGDEKAHRRRRITHSIQDWLSQWRPQHQSKTADTIAVSTHQPEQLTFEIVVEQVSDAAERVDNSHRLPFDPSNLDQSEIERSLCNIDQYEEDIREEIYSYGKDFYSENPISDDPSDIININQILNYAEAKGHDSWKPRLEQQLEEYFTDLRVDRELLIRAVDNGECVSPSRARQLYEREISQIESAIGSVYEDQPIEQQKEVIRAEKQEALCKIASKVEY